MQPRPACLGNGGTHYGLRPPLSITNTNQPSQTCSQASLIQAIPQFRLLSQVSLGYCRLPFYLSHSYWSISNLNTSDFCFCHMNSITYPSSFFFSIFAGDLSLHLLVFQRSARWCSGGLLHSTVHWWCWARPSPPCHSSIYSTTRTSTATLITVFQL